MTNTSNKGYPLQTTGTNVGIWGTIVNGQVFQVIDNNLGGTLAVNVAGNSNVNLTASQASFLMHDLTGALTGNIAYIFPALGGFYAINNKTTGAFSVTVQVVGGGASVVAAQNATTIIFIDATGLNVLAQTTTTVAAAGTLTGTTLASNVVNSSLTGVGPLISGSLAAGFTPVTVPLGGTGRTTLTTGNVLLGAGASPPTFVAPSTSGNVLTSNGTMWISSAVPATPTATSSTLGIVKPDNTTITISAGVISAVGGGAANVYQATPSNPTGTNSATPVMMGLAGAITPANSGTVHVTICGNAVENGAIGIIGIGIRYGTGSAPTNGIASAGTLTGAALQYNPSSQGGNAGNFSITSIISGLTPGTTYWLDLSLSNNNANTSTLSNITISAFEIK